MAMDKEEDGVSMTPETIAMLEDQVKKGKARKFFLIHKGASIKTLEVFKKGAFGPKIAAAKKSGFKGDVVYGVVSGGGVNLYFYLAATPEVAAAMKVDGWTDAPPTKTTKLREFLADAGLKFKPSYHLIRNANEAPDPDSEADTAIGPPPAGTEVGDDEAQTSNQPPVSNAEGTTQNQPEQVASSSVPNNQEVSNEASAFAERLKALLPQIKAAAGSPVGDEAKVKASEAVALSKALSFVQANSLLDQIESLLSASPQSDANTNAKRDSALAIWQKVKIDVLTKLKDELKWVVSTQDPLAAGAELELRAVMKQINGTLETKQQSVELERYLDQDDVVADLCEFAFDLKTPLLKVLRGIQPHLPA